MRAKIATVALLLALELLMVDRPRSLEESGFIYVHLYEFSWALAHINTVDRISIVDDLLMPFSR